MAEVDTNWQYRGLQVVRLENDLIRMDVLPEVGAKIYNFIHKPSGRNLLWHNPNVPPARQAFGACFDDNWSGGWDELIPNDMPGAEPAGDLLPDHGEVWSQQARWQATQGTSETANCCSPPGKSGKTSEACCPPGTAEVRFVTHARVLPVQFEKTLQLRDGESFVRVHYRISNRGFEPYEFLWNIHPAMNITPDTRLDVPAGEGFTDPWRKKQFPGYGKFHWPMVNDHQGRPVDLRKVSPCSANIADHHYLMGVREGWYAVTDQKARVGFGLVFPKEVMPNVWLFRTFGGWRGLYTLILEVSNGCSRDIQEARTKGQCGRLEPGATLDMDVLAVAYGGITSVARIEPDGRVIPG